MKPAPRHAMSSVTPVQAAARGLPPSLLFAGIAVLVLLSCALSLGLGAVSLRELFFATGATGTVDTASDSTDAFAAVLSLRAVRLASCVFVGALLALCGSVLQRLLRNPLADPFVLGISSGGTVFVVGATVLGLPIVTALGFPLRGVYAFIGCLVALGLLLAARSRVRGPQDAGLALLGLVLNAFFSAALLLFVAFASASQLADAQRWMLGSLQLVSPRELAFLVALSLAPVVLLLRARTGLDALFFGDAYAQTLGFRATAIRRQALLCTALLVALVVSLAGSVGFVGLIVPHLARYLSRRAPRAEFAVSLGLGATLVLWADVLARTVAAPAELPVGVFTACLGAPVLAAVLLRRNSGDDDAG